MSALGDNKSGGVDGKTEYMNKFDATTAGQNQCSETYTAFFVAESSGQ